MNKVWIFALSINNFLDQSTTLTACDAFAVPDSNSDTLSDNAEGSEHSDQHTERLIIFSKLSFLSYLLNYT